MSKEETMLTTMVDAQGFAPEQHLAAPELRAKLTRFVRSKVPESDVEDVVQETLADALSAKASPRNAEELHRWVFGIARHKIADHFRRQGRGRVSDEVLDHEVAAESAPPSARDLLRWAKQELPDQENAEGTLDWMLREGAGERLEEIAREHNQPAPRVRQRVSRMRQYFRRRWATQLAAVAALTLVALTVAYLYRSGEEPPEKLIAEEIEPVSRQQQLRQQAFRACDESAWQRCLDLLNEARKLDPDGDRSPEVQRNRRAAARGLQPVAPAPSERPPPVSSEQAPAPSAPRAVPKEPIMPKREKVLRPRAVPRAKSKSKSAFPLPTDY